MPGIRLARIVGRESIGGLVRVVRKLAEELLHSDDVVVADVQTPGMETKAFQIAADRNTGCLRIGRDLGSFRKDAWAWTRFGDQLPVPAVRAYGSLHAGYAYCLTEWMPASTLQDLSVTEVAPAVPEVFDAWQRLSHFDVTDTTGFGVLDPENMIAPYSTHRDQLRAELDHAVTEIAPNTGS